MTASYWLMLLRAPSRWHQEMIPRKSQKWQPRSEFIFTKYWSITFWFLLYIRLSAGKCCNRYTTAVKKYEHYSYPWYIGLRCCWTPSGWNKYPIGSWKTFDCTKVSVQAFVFQGSTDLFGCEPMFMVRHFLVIKPYWYWVRFFRVSNTSQNSVELSNFSMKQAGYCGYSQVYNSRHIEEANGEVIVLKSDQIKECKWVSFNGTFSKLPGFLYCSNSFYFKARTVWLRSKPSGIRTMADWLITWT